MNGVTNTYSSGAETPSGGLTPMEQSLVEHVRSGEWLDLTHGLGDVLDEAAMREWDDSRTCPAAVIRGILCGRLVADPDPHGVRLRGARISGRLDLENLTTDVNLELKDCFLPEGVLARGARLAAVSLTGCQLGLTEHLTQAGDQTDPFPTAHRTDPPLDAPRLTCSVLDLTGVRIIGHAPAGAVNLIGAHIDRSLDCDGASLRNDSGPALVGDSLRVGRAINLRDGFTAARAAAHGVRATGARPGAVRLAGARIGGSLDCTGASLHSDSGPALSADGLQVGQAVFFRRGFTATGTTGAGAIRLASANIGGSLECDGQVILRNDSGPALAGDGLQVSQSIVLRDGFVATAFSVYGAVRLTGVRIGGRLDCRGARVRNNSGPALVGEGLQAGQNILLGGGFTATGSKGEAAVRLRGVRIGGSLDCDGAWLTSNTGPALDADGLQAGQDIRLTGGFDSTGGGRYGTVSLRGARIDGSLDCSGAKLLNDSGPALSADGLQVGQAVYLSGRFTAKGGASEGAVRLTGAHIDRSLDCSGARLRNSTGPALVGERLQVGQTILLNNGFTAIAFGAHGAVNLRGAHIEGSLDCSGAMLLNNSGPALSANGVQVGQSAHLSEGFIAACSAGEGAVLLGGALIGGSLDCDGARLRNESGPALSADGLQVGQAMLLNNGFTAAGGGAEAAVNLTGARVDGTLAFNPASLKHAGDPDRRLAVDGLTYTGVPQPILAQDWLDLLQQGTPVYAAQPYQQLAAGYRALGDERQARTILMAQRDDELTRTDTRWTERVWGKITKWTLGYGYQPWRALLFLAAVVVISCILTVVLGSHGALAQTKNMATPGQPCTVIQKASLGLTLSLPVGTSVAQAGCDLAKDAASTTADWLTAVGWVLRLLAWGFAALFVAGFTSAVRKT
jgi:hypothetical protein